jgi:hypothetical protein
MAAIKKWVVDAKEVRVDVTEWMDLEISKAGSGMVSRGSE